jgi:hypothetical protein
MGLCGYGGDCGDAGSGSEVTVWLGTELNTGIHG